LVTSLLKQTNWLKTKQGSTNPLTVGPVKHNKDWPAGPTIFVFSNDFRVIQYRLITRTNEISWQNVKIQLQSLAESYK
jgi:hypothetical protein